MISETPPHERADESAEPSVGSAPLAHPLADGALKRIASLCKGNGPNLTPKDIIEIKEQIYSLTGIVTLVPKMDVQRKGYAGTANLRGHRQLANFAALEQEIATLKSKFSEGRSWFNDAVQELGQNPGHGWGMGGGRVTLPSVTQILVATESCPSCNGRGRLVCEKCNGQKGFTCQFCLGNKMETCPNCQGRGQDPNNPEMSCSQCGGNRQIICRHCSGRGMEVCSNCRGSGTIACAPCQGKGRLTQEAALESGAELDFKLDRGSTPLPAGLLRAFERLGMQNLHKGHADITFDDSPFEDPEKNQDNIKLKAVLPYADIKLRLNGKGSLISVFGKHGLIMGAPPFVDIMVEQQRAHLKEAAKNPAALDLALKARLMSEVLELQLKGQGKLQELRQRYPLGLSKPVMEEVLQNMQAALARLTQKTRIVAADVAVLIGAGGSWLYAFMHVRNWLIEKLPTDAHILPDFFVMMILLTLGWVIMREAGGYVLRQKFRGKNVKFGGGKSGLIGKAALGTIALMFLVFLWYGPERPVWLQAIANLI